MCKTKFLCFIKQPSFVSSKRIDQLHNMFARLSSSLNLGSRYSLKLPKWMLYFFKKMIFFVFSENYSNNHYKFYNKLMSKMFIQNTLQGFEPTNLQYLSSLP